MTKHPRTDSGFSKFAKLSKQLGFWNALLYAADRVLQTLPASKLRIMRYHLVAQPVTQVAPPPPSRVTTGTEINFCSADSPDIADFPRPASIIQERFLRGHRCLQVRRKGEFAAYLWLCQQFYDEDEVRCRFILPTPQHSIWDYDVYVAPQYRLGRTFSQLWHTANSHLATEGVKWSFSRISAFNPESIRAHTRLGSVSLLSVTFIIIGGLQVSVFSAAPYLHLSWSATERTVIHLPSPEK